jgi:hypothetical protein
MKKGNLMNRLVNRSIVFSTACFFATTLFAENPSETPARPENPAQTPVIAEQSPSKTPEVAEQSPAQTPNAAQTPATPDNPPKAQVIAQGVDLGFEDKQVENDMDALRRFLQDKRLVSLKELGGDLSISGEVRTEGQFANERLKAQGSPTFIQQRGINSATKAASLAWDVEFNLMLDYRTPRTWAAMKVELDNDMGIVSGRVDKVRLEKAYLGGRLIDGDTFTWDAEIGRRYLGNVFDSKLEFATLFDGFLFRFGKAFESIGDFYTNIGIFLVNDQFNHYGEVMEIGALKIANTPLNMRYSIINWYRHYTQPQLQNKTQQAPGAEFTQPWRYLVNQYQIFYQIYPHWLGKRLFKVYAAGLVNAIAEGIPQTGGTKQNLGFYAGVAMGLVKKAGDWATDVNYQYAQAQVVPPRDSGGIGHGNAAGAGFFTTEQNNSGLITTSKNALSPNNFHGFQVEALYGFTNNLTLQQTLQMSWTLDKKIGPNIQYKQYEIEFIYAF